MLYVARDHAGFLRSGGLVVVRPRLALKRLCQDNTSTHGPALTRKALFSHRKLRLRAPRSEVNQSFPHIWRVAGLSGDSVSHPLHRNAGMHERSGEMYPRAAGRDQGSSSAPRNGFSRPALCFEAEDAGLFPAAAALRGAPLGIEGDADAEGRNLARKHAGRMTVDLMNAAVPAELDEHRPQFAVADRGWPLA